MIRITTHIRWIIFQLQIWPTLSKKSNNLGWTGSVVEDPTNSTAWKLPKIPTKLSHRSQTLSYQHSAACRTHQIYLPQHFDTIQSHIPSTIKTLMNLVILLMLGRLGHQGSAKKVSKVTIKLEFLYIVVSSLRIWLI